MRPASVGFQCPDDVKAGRIVTRNEVGAPVPNPSSPRRPWATFTILAANVIIYLITMAQSVGGINDPQASLLFRKWVLVPWSAAHGTDGQGQELYRLITSAFLHISLTHLAFNMIALYVFGVGLERILGWWRFAAVYLLAAVGGSVAVFLFDSKYTAVAGASGGIYGLFAASFLLLRKLGLDTRAMVTVIAINVVFTFAAPNVSWLGHLGGFVGGGLAALCITQVPSAWRKSRTAAQITGLGVVLVVLVVVITLRTIAI
jgi:membrane associated rhomboid family serine protease